MTEDLLVYHSEQNEESNMNTAGGSRVWNCRNTSGLTFYLCRDGVNAKGKCVRPEVLRRPPQRQPSDDLADDERFHPVEIIPGTWRYPFQEIIAFARTGVESVAEAPTHREKSAV